MGEALKFLYSGWGDGVDTRDHVVCLYGQDGPYFRLVAEDNPSFQLAFKINMVQMKSINNLRPFSNPSHSSLPLSQYENINGLIFFICKKK